MIGATAVAAGSYHTLALGSGSVRQTTPANTADLNASYVDSGGDPVQTNSGVFVYRKTDIAIPGRGPSPTLTRFYNSSDTAISALGQGWTHNYATRLHDPGDGSGALVLLTPEGRRDRYTRNPDGTYNPPPASTSHLVKNGDGTYTLTNPDQSVWGFNSQGKLTRVADRHGNTSVLTYNVAGQLASVSDPAGRGSLTFAYHPSTGRLISVTDWYLPARVVQFGYDANNRLQTVTDREGKTTTYAYECCGMVRRLTKITDANGRVAIQNAYDTQGRVTSQKDARGQTTGKTTTFGYMLNGDGSKVTTITYPSASFQTTFNPQQIDSYDPQGRIVQRVWKPTSDEAYTTSYGYDASFFTTSVTDARGNTTILCYDADYAAAPVPGSRGNLTRKIAPAPAAGQNPLVTLFKYDGENNLLQTVPPKGVANGAAVTCATDLSAVVNMAYAADFAYDASGTKLLSATHRFTDPDLGLRTATTKYEYGDAANPGMATKVIAPRGNTAPTPDYTYATTLTYHTTGSQAGLLQKTADPLGNSTTFAYDEVGRRTSMVDPMGNPPSAESPSRHTWNYVYDKEDRVLHETSPGVGGPLTGREHRYDAVGNRVVTIDGNGQVTKFVYDERDSLKEVQESPDSWTDPAVTPTGLIVTAYQHDDLGTLKRVTRAQGTADERVTDYAYDGLKRLRRETQYPSWPTASPTLVTSLTYDGNGNRLTLVDPLNRTTAFGYDNADRVTSVTYSDGTTPNVAYQYDAAGNRTQMTDGTGTTTYAVDELGRPTAITAPGYPSAKTVGYRYDLDGNRTKLIYPDATGVTYQYDAAGRPWYAEDWQGFNFVYLYRPDGRVRTWSNVNGVTTTYAYDEAQRLTSVEHADASGITGRWGYTLDGAGNRTHVDEQLPQIGAPPISTEMTFGYDRLYRLLNVGQPNSCVWPNPCAPYRAASYTYDRAGNRLTGSTGGGPTASYAYDKADRITSADGVAYTVNDAGNTVAVGGAAYGYDQANRLVSAPTGSTTVQYTYDGDGNRASATVGQTTTRWVYDRSGSLPVVLDDGARKYVYGLGLAYVVENHTTRFAPLQDGLGTVRALADPAGNVVQTYETYAFGEPVQTQGSSQQPVQFTGEHRDADTGLIYLRARMYDPRIGRFLSRDTLFGSLTSPLSLNRYSYVHNNPINAVDPSGHCMSKITREDPHCDLGGESEVATNPCEGLLQYFCYPPRVSTPFGPATLSPDVRAGADALGGLKDDLVRGAKGAKKGGGGHTVTNRIKSAGLPRSGKIRYVPPDKIDPARGLPRGLQHGYLDRFGNEWVWAREGHWDVQLSPAGKSQLGWASPSGNHVNVSTDGRILH